MVNGICEEFEGVEVGDARLNRRILKVVQKISQQPKQSFPGLLTRAELLGFYRLIGHKDVTPEQLMEPHYQATAQRAAQAEKALALHDDTNVVHGRGGKGRDFYELGTNLHGYVCHVSLLVGAERCPLGVGNVAFVDRSPEAKAARSEAEVPNESVRWLEGVRTVEARYAGMSLVHVMDSDADSYALLSMLVRGGHRFIVRGEVRNVAVHTGGRWETCSLLDRLHQEPVKLVREVLLSAREASDPKSKRNPPRAERTAVLQVRAASVLLQRPDNVPGTGVRGHPVRLAMNVVLVEELNPPPDVEPVQWVLLTREAIEVTEQIEGVVDDYRARWVIEELFKALKTGCALKQRQMESQHSSQNVVAMLLPIAFRMLLLRHVERQHSSAPAEQLLGDALAVLRMLAEKPLPPQPTVADAMAAIARLGGHLPYNGPPGWLVLNRGLEKLQQALLVYYLLTDQTTDGSIPTSDTS